MGRKILFVTTDQMRYDALGCNGGQLARTPVVDGLAAQGVRYERAVPQSVVCMPSRSTMLTGQHPSTHGVWMNGVPLEPDAPSGQYMIDVDGQGPEAPMTVQCDMDTDEGGWTLIGSLVNGDGRKWNSLPALTDASAFGALDTYTSGDYKSPGWALVSAQHLLVRTEDYAVGWTFDLLAGSSFGDWIVSGYDMQACSSEFVGGTPQFAEGLSDQQQLIFDIVVRPLDTNCSCFPGCNENALIGFVFPACCWTYGLGNTPAGQGTWSSHDHSMPKATSLTRQVCNGGYPCNPAGSINGGVTCYDTSCKTSYASVWVR